MTTKQTEINDQAEQEKLSGNNDLEKDNKVDSSPKSRMDFLRQWSQTVKTNKHLLVVVIACVLLIIMFIITIALAVQLNQYQCPRYTHECLTSECLRASTSIVAAYNNSVDPCSNFWKYACGGWFSRNPLPGNRGSYGVKDKLKETIYKRVRHLIDLIPQDSDPSTPQWKVNKFFRACMTVEEMNYWGPEALKRKIYEFGGWKVLKEFQLSRWNFHNALKKLQLDYGVHPYFKIFVEADDKDPLKNIIKIAPDGLGLPGRKYYFKGHDYKYARAYKEFIRDVIKVMEGINPTATRFAEDMFHYEKRLAEITPYKKDLRNTEDSYKILSVQELKNIAPSIDWQDLLSTYFPTQFPTHSIMDSKVAVYSEQYFKDVSQLISTTDKVVQNDYLIWRFVSAYIPHLSRNYTELLNQLTQTFEGVKDTTRPAEKRWEFCVRMTSHYLGHSIGDMYIQQYFPDVIGNDLQAVLSKFILAAIINVNSIPWLDDMSSRDIAMEKIRAMMVLVGSPQSHKQETLTKYYEELKVQNEHLQNVMDAEYFFRKKQQALLEKDAVAEQSWTINAHDITAEYKYVGNVLVIPAGLLENPIFSPDMPMAVKYGSLAGYLANKLSLILDPTGVLYDSQGKLNPWLQNASTQAYLRQQKCLITALTNNSHGVNINSTVEKVAADIGGVKFAFEAYKKANTNQDITLPGLSSNTDQLFFISYAQSMCQAYRPEKLEAWEDNVNNYPNEFFVMTSLQQLPEFASTFNCPKQSIMNQDSRCHIW